MKVETVKRLQNLVVLLSDGRFHSGEFLAGQLGISRTAIWKLVNKLQEWQIEIYAVRGKGYKIPNGLSLLDQEYLKKRLAGKLKLFSIVEVLPTLDSTSSYLTREWQKKPNVSRICIAEHQTEGRGRKGRKWISPFGTNLYFSMGLNLPMGLSALGGLSLAVGIALTQTLNELSNQKIELKWPNDLLVNGRKLSGILVEASGETNDTSFLNIGVGINWDMRPEQSAIDQPWINLKSLLNEPLSRNDLLAMILKSIDSGLNKYIEDGFESFYKKWSYCSAFYGKPIVIHTRQGDIQGEELGIDKSGAIKILTEQGEKRFFSGEVSLRGLPT